MENPVIISIGGGKGGVGKSSLVAGIGIRMAHEGCTVGFMDADLGGANLHTLLGVPRPRKGLKNFLLEKEPLSQAVIPLTLPNNSWLISGASDILAIANPRYSHKKRLITHINKMEADYVLVDLGAGSSHNVTDFFAAFPYGIVVTDGQAASIENAYAFMKNSIVRGLARLFPGRKDVQTFVTRCSASGRDSFATVGEMIRTAAATLGPESRTMKEWLAERKYFLALNMVRQPEDVSRGQKFIEIIKKYLGVSMVYIGYVTYTGERAVLPAAGSPIEGLFTDRKVNECLSTLAKNIIAVTRG